MKEEGTMLGLSPGLRDPGHPFPFPGFPRGLPVLPHANGGGMSLPLPHGPGPASPAMPNMWPFIWSHISNLLPQLSIARLDPLSQVFSLRWTQHQANMFSVFERLLHSEAFTDVTLACDGGSLKCHKIVLAASSDYFQKLFIDNSSEHPIVFLKDVKASQVQSLLDYMYRGEVSVSQDDLPALLRVAEMLRIKGMTEESAKPQSALPIGGRKDSQASGASQPLRCSSPGPASSPLAPPNSVVPNNGDSASIPASSSIVMPPASKTPTSVPPPHGAIPPNFRPFLTPPGASSSSPFPMWPLPGLFPGAHNLFGHRHDERKELSPGARDRSKMSSGSSSDKDMQLPPLIPRDNEDRDKETGSNSSFDKDSEQYNEKMKLEGIAGYVPAQRLEWKRYKQYTRNDIMAAIEEVKKGKSALQVSKKYNIPSRTLYDKVKKMGITTGRQQQRKSMNTGSQGSNFSYSAAFPGLSGLSGLPQMPHLTSDPGMGENPYKSLLDRMKVERGIKDNHEEEAEDKSAESGPRKDLGPMPFSILPPHMLNMMERIRGEEKEKMVEESERQEREREAEAESSPMNLSSERDPEKRMSEGSFPHSPSPGSTDPTTSPSNCQNSPQGGSGSDYNGGGRDRDRSPDNSAQIDIRAQFLADLRRLGDRRGMTSPELGSPRQDNLPPRKRKVSHEHEAGDTGNGTVGTGSKISLTIASDGAVVN